MQIQVIPFTTEEAWLELRTHDLTSSDIPCLFGCGYTSYQQLLEAKKIGMELKVEPNERLLWGVALQDSIAGEFADRNNWDICKKTEYIRIPELRIGSSFDFEINGEDETPEGEAYSTKTLLEIKNVSLDSYKQWIRGFEIQMTPYIELQVQHQMLVSGIDICIVGALIGGCEGKLIKREANKKIQEAILMKAKEFWRMIDESK